MKIENDFYTKAAQFNTRFFGTEKTNKSEPNADFQNVLKNCIDEVNQKSVESDAATNAFVSGDDISIDQVMMKATEANLSLQFLTTTRDKLVEGYKELIKMSV